MNKLCAITGSNGYVGSCMKRFFTTCGWEVLELTRRPVPSSRAGEFHLGQHLQPQLLGGVGALVHCAYDFAPLRRKDIAAVNVEGSRKVLESARAASISKIVCLSTISAFPGCRSLYGQAKLEIEKIALAAGALVIRPGLVYGTQPGGMFGRLAEQIRKSAVVPIVGDGSQIQFLVHNEDLCAFIEKFASGRIESAPRILTAANEQPWPLKELLVRMARWLDRNPRFVGVPWRVVWLALKSAELCGLRLKFRSDNLVGLMYPNPKPDFSANAQAGLVCRPFELGKERWD